MWYAGVRVHARRSYMFPLICFACASRVPRALGAAVDNVDVVVAVVGHVCCCLSDGKLALTLAE